MGIIDRVMDAINDYFQDRANDRPPEKDRYAWIRSGHIETPSTCQSTFQTQDFMVDCLLKNNLYTGITTTPTASENELSDMVRGFRQACDSLLDHANKVHSDNTLAYQQLKDECWNKWNGIERTITNRFAPDKAKKILQPMAPAGQPASSVRVAQHRAPAAVHSPHERGLR